MPTICITKSINEDENSSTDFGISFTGHLINEFIFESHVSTEGCIIHELIWQSRATRRSSFWRIKDPWKLISSSLPQEGYIHEFILKSQTCSTYATRANSFCRVKGRADGSYCWVRFRVLRVRTTLSNSSSLQECSYTLWFTSPLNCVIYHSWQPMSPVE